MRKLRVAIYIRVSTQEQAVEGYSISAQTERLTAYCKAKGWIVVEIYADPGFSGANMDRPGLHKLIKDIDLNKFDTLLVYKLDRLSRSQKDTLYIIEDILLQNDIDFVSMCENLDTSSPFGRAMIGILSCFAQLEREQIKERMAMGREARAKAGRWHGSVNTPLGYKYIDDKLVIDDYEASLIREIFNRHINGESSYSISQDMYKRYPQYKNFRNGANGISDILTRITYAGKISHNNEVYEGLHEAIIDQDTFDKAQEIRDNKAKYNRHKSGSEHLLTGILFCGKCGARYGYWVKGSNCTYKGVTTKYYYPRYICYSRHKPVKSMIKDPNCKNKIWKPDELETIIKGEIIKLSFDDKYLNEISETEIVIDNRKASEKKLKEIDSQIDRLVELYSIQDINMSVIQKKVKLLNDQRQEIKNAIIDNQTIIEKRKETKDLLNVAQDIFDNGTPADQRKLVLSLIDHIDINDEDIKIFWKF